jgi:hypothetical protein
MDLPKSLLGKGHPGCRMRPWVRTRTVDVRTGNLVSNLREIEQYLRPDLVGSLHSQGGLRKP